GGTVERGHGTDDDGGAVRARLLRPRRSAGAADPRDRRRALPAGRVAMAAGAAAADLDGLVPGDRLHRARLAGLQRGDAGLHPRLGVADAPDRTGRLGGLDEHLRPWLGTFRGPGVPELRAAVRAPVQRGVDRL